MDNNIWNSEIDDKIFALRDQGLSFTQIATILGRTKNAVIGRYGRQKKIREGNGEIVSRIAAPRLTQEENDKIIEFRKNGLSAFAIAGLLGRSKRAIQNRIKAHTSHVSAREKTVSLFATKEYRSSRPEADQCFAESGGVTLMDLTERSCRWPVGDPRHNDFRFCGDYAEPGRVYCCQHHALAYYRTTPISNSRIKDMQRV